MNRAAQLVILTGGQTGVDRAAHNAAIALAVSCAGWCPEGRRAEDGVIPERYPVQELRGANYLQRSLKNVLDSDATTLVAFGGLADGTVRVVEFCRKYQKPLLVLDGLQHTADEAGVAAAAFVERHSITRLHVTGPRASREPRGYEYAYALVTAMLTALRPRAARQHG